MKAKVISNTTRANGTIPNCLKKRLGELEIHKTVKTTQTTVLLRSAKILRRVLDK